VANDLLPLGYSVTIYEKLERAGGLMWNNIPRFRLPPRVLDEEIGAILEMGVDLRTGHPVDSLRAVLEEGWDAVFIGSGAPRGKELELPGRHDSDRVHIGIAWLQSIAFGHVERIEPRVLVIGVGNTAMDCCRSALRLGATDVKVIARRSRPHFKASPWELEDAEEEGVEIVENHAPKRFLVEDGVLVGMEFDRVEWSAGEDGRETSRTLETVVIPCDDVILAIGQEAAFPWIEPTSGSSWTAGGRRWWTAPPGRPPSRASSWAATRRGAPRTSSGRWSTGTRRRSRSTCTAREARWPSARTGDEPRQPEDGAARVELRQRLRRRRPRADAARGAGTERLRSLEVEVELGFDFEQTLKEAARCLNCDVQTHFTDPLCIECDACVDVCPMGCLTILPDAEEDAAARAATVPGAQPAQPLFASGPLPQTGRLMLKDEDLCIHCGLCAERCPTAAWDMRSSELLLPYAGLAAGASHRARGPRLPVLPALPLVASPAPAGAA
jgi:formate dehydrogenase (NADP+) beta subunit